MGLVLSLWTVLVAVLFIGVVAWTLSRKRTAEFDAAARMPLEDDDSDGHSDGDEDGDEATGEKRHG